MPVTAVLFDMDGTVIEFTFDVAGARRAVVDVLRESGVPDQILSECLMTYQMLSLGSRYLEDQGVDPSPMLDRAYDELERLDLRSADNPRLTPGMDEVLTFLKARSIPVILVTNSSERAASAVLSQLRLENLFAEVVARRKGLRLKPHPDMILEGLSRISVAPSQDVYFVGDSWADMRASLLAGIRCIGYNRIEPALQDLLAAGAVAAFARMSDVREYLERALD